MLKIEKDFDINGILLKVFSALETLRDEKNIELIYDMDANIPRDLKGDESVFTRLLTKVLTFVFQYTDKKEIVVTLHSPEDFLYEEFISFKIDDTQIPKDKILDFIEKNITEDIEILEGNIAYDQEVDIAFNIPFQISELGHRRHYRLPDIGMLGKKVLLISQSKKMALSIKKMFTYFLYTVDIGFDEFRKQGNDLSQYDILVIDDMFSTDELEQIVAKVQKELSLKYVLLRDAHIIGSRSSDVIFTHLIKPVTQESIFELISALFYHDTDNRQNRSKIRKCVIDLEKILHKNNFFKEKTQAVDILSSGSLNHIIEKKKEVKEVVLDTKQGEENTREKGLVYAKELRGFLEVFDRSDIYFRQIVNEKSIHKIKEFCIDLDTQSKLVGAQSMVRFSESISLIFVYGKLDMLPIYPGRYHMELENLLEAIRKHLGIK